MFGRSLPTLGTDLPFLMPTMEAPMLDRPPGHTPKPEIPGPGYYALRCQITKHRVCWVTTPCDFWDDDCRLIVVGSPEHPATVTWS